MHGNLISYKIKIVIAWGKSISYNDTPLPLIRDKTTT
jgi:hypothetical protein